MGLKTRTTSKQTPGSGPGLGGLAEGLRSRPPIERMMRIHQALTGGSFPNASTLARELEVSSKSIHRDIEFMRDRLGMPLEYDRRRHGFYYREPVHSFPALEITEGELFAMVVADQALQQYRGTSFEQPLLRAMRKIAAVLPETISLNLSEWRESISFRTTSAPLHGSRVLDFLAAAARNGEQIEVVYKKPGDAQSMRRVLDPYHLANINGDWFLFAHDHLRQDVRTFSPARMRAWKKTGARFERPRDFSVAHRLEKSFGVRLGPGEHQVVIRFDEFAAQYIQEKRWHGSQRVREIPGGIELSLKLSSVAEVKRWILAWGEHAVVLAPRELARSIADTARQILKHYPHDPEAEAFKDPSSEPAAARSGGNAPAGGV